MLKQPHKLLYHQLQERHKDLKRRSRLKHNGGSLSVISHTHTQVERVKEPYIRAQQRRHCAGNEPALVSLIRHAEQAEGAASTVQRLDTLLAKCDTQHVCVCVCVCESNLCVCVHVSTGECK